MELTESDDFFHEPTTEERWWSETYWFSFDDPATGLSGTFYPLLRTNLDIAALTVAVWGPDQETAWTAPYYRSYWHLKPPVFKDGAMALEGLRYDVLQPLHKYRVRYEDGDTFRADLVIEGVSDNHVLIASPDVGHWDQPTRVAGTLKLGAREVSIGCHGMRDRSWGPRLDSSSARASYVYGINESSSFLVITQMSAEPWFTTGYVEKDGTRSPITEASQNIERDGWHRATAVTIVCTDALGRRLSISGKSRNHLAKQPSPGYFAWMSMFEWDFAGGAVGEFQDVWSPDRLSLEAGSRVLPR